MNEVAPATTTVIAQPTSQMVIVLCFEAPSVRAAEMEVTSKSLPAAWA